MLVLLLVQGAGPRAQGDGLYEELLDHVYLPCGQGDEALHGMPRAHARALVEDLFGLEIRLHAKALANTGVSDLPAPDRRAAYRILAGHCLDAGRLSKGRLNAYVDLIVRFVGLHRALDGPVR